MHGAGALVMSLSKLAADSSFFIRCVCRCFVPSSSCLRCAYGNKSQELYKRAIGGLWVWRLRGLPSFLLGEGKRGAVAIV